jgi:hypothetical protein
VVRQVHDQFAHSDVKLCDASCATLAWRNGNEVLSEHALTPHAAE